MSHVGNFAHANESHSGAGGVPSNENDPYTAPQRGRVMMIMDENGNATQVTLGEYHVESVHRNSGRTSDETAEAYIAPTHRQTMRKADTVRANIPAPFNNIKTGSDVSEDGEVGPPRAKSSGGTDIQFEHVEDECVLDADDAENDQYMRIAIPASKLKDVRKVKKDLYHDKPERQGSRLSNLTRAISLKGADRIRAAPATEVKSTSQSSKNSIARVGRMMSLPKQKRPSAVVEEQRNHSISDRPRGSPQGRSNGRSNPPGLIDGHPKPQMRRSISMVGRMLSKSRSKGGTVNMPAQGPSTNSINAPAADNVLQERPRASNDSDRMSERSSKAKPGGGVRAGLRQLGRTMSMNRSKPSEPQNQRQGSRKYSDSGSAGSGLSLDRQRSEENSKSNAGSSAPRKGLAQIGRTLSKLRPKASAVQTSSPQSSSTVSPCTDSSTDPFADSSPNSLGAVSVVSSAQSQTSSKGPDRDRDRESTRSTSGLAASSNASKKEATRKALKATGRALSFSRKPKQEGARKETKAEGLNSWSAAHVARANEKASACEGDGSAVIEPLTAEKLDGRANNFFFSDVNSEKIRACGLLGEDNTHIRVPVLVLGEYSGPVSRSRWFIDAFTLPHNAVRRECMDLYDILIAIAKQGPPGDVTSDDMRDFYDWWAVAREFFNCYFDVERKVMFPWVDAAGAEDWEVQLALRKMRGMKEKLKEQLDKVETAWAGRNERSPEETFVLVYKAVDAFAPKLMNYFADQEILLPAIVKGFYKIEDRLKMDKDMVAVFASGGDKNRDDAKHHVVLLARWITNPRQMRAWISKNLNASGRSMFPKWQEVFESEHHRIVKTFCNRIVVRDA